MYTFKLNTVVDFYLTHQDLSEHENECFRSALIDVINAVFSNYDPSDFVIELHDNHTNILIQANKLKMGLKTRFSGLIKDFHKKFNAKDIVAFLPSISSVSAELVESRLSPAEIAQLSHGARFTHMRTINNASNHILLAAEPDSLLSANQCDEFFNPKIASQPN